MHQILFWMAKMPRPQMVMEALESSIHGMEEALKAYQVMARVLLLRTLKEQVSERLTIIITAEVFSCSWE